MRKLTILLLILLLSISTYSCGKYFAIENPKINNNNNDGKDDALSDDQNIEYINKNENNENNENNVETLDEAEEENITGYEEPASLRVDVEGTTEDIKASLFHSPLGYKMIYDHERFKRSDEENGIDRYKTENPDPEQYPDVYIRLGTSKSPDTIINEFDGDQESITTLDGFTADFVEDVTLNTYDARHYKLKTGDERDSIIKNFYIIETDDIYYIIETQYFLEAAEGYGARITAMLNTFELY